MKEITELANQMLDKHNENWDLAIEDGTKILMNDPELLDLYVKPLAQEGFKEIFYNIAHIRRNNAFNYSSSSLKFTSTCPKGVSGETLQRKESIEAEVTVIARVYLMNQWMNKSKKTIGEATRKDLIIESNMHFENVKGNEKQAIFYRTLADKMKSKELVKEKFTEDQLRETQQSVYKRITKKINKKIAEVSE